jgi:NADH:ubiquinone oxidoreductase subunit F (NADH-binding)
MDRDILEGNLHAVLEGMVVGANQGEAASATNIGPLGNAVKERYHVRSTVSVTPPLTRYVQGERHGLRGFRPGEDC